MTPNELKSEFNLYYNNLASNMAPGLDDVEISVYLTKGQEVLLDALYNEFEKSEEARRKLAPVVDTSKLTVITVPDARILYPEYTTAFKPIENLRYIVNEQVKMASNANTCIKGKHLKVHPCSHDELDNTIENPYKFNIRRALRLDTSNNGSKYIEILTKDKHIDYYQVRYVRTPEPIMIYTSSDYTDTINSYSPLSTPRPATLPDETHRQIVEIAAKLAYQDYKNS